MSTVKLAVIQGRESSVSLRDLVTASSGLCELVLLAPPDLDPSLGRALAAVGTVIDSAPERWVPELARRGVAGVTTFDDHFVDVQDELAAALELPGVTGLPSSWDKAVQRDALTASGASRIASVRVSSPAGLEAARERFSRSGIVKPCRSSTSRGVVVDDPSLATDDVWAAAASNYGHLVYEELMDASPDFDGSGRAPFVSVDTASVGVERRHFGLFDKLPLARGTIETGDIAPTSLGPREVDGVLRVVDLALNVLGVRDRVTHTEVRLTSVGPQVIEVNGRLGGYVQGLLRRSTGADACRAALQVALGDALDPPLPSGRDVGREHAVGLLLLPMETSSPQLVRRALAELRASPGARAVETPAPVSDDFRCAAAWFEGSSAIDVRDLATAAALALASDDEIRAAIDATWLRELAIGAEAR